MQELVVQPFGKQGSFAILGFDGRVLEVFGFSEVQRYHVARLRIDILEARRDGSIPMRIVGPGRSLTMIVGPDQIDEVTQFLEPVRAAAGAPLTPAPTETTTSDAPAAAGPEASEGEHADIAELVRSGQRVEAITRYRAQTGASYSEAQAFISRL